MSTKAERTRCNTRTCQRRIGDLMQLTTTELKLLKMHCKIDHNSEDKLLETYYSWAFYEIVSAVTDDYIEYEDWFKSNPLLLVLYTLWLIIILKIVSLIRIEIYHLHLIWF